MLGIVELVEKLWQGLGRGNEPWVLHRDLDGVPDRLHRDGDAGAPGRVLDDLEVEDVPQLVETPAHDRHLGDRSLGFHLHPDVLDLGLGLEIEGQALDFRGQVDLLVGGCGLLDFHLVDV